MNEKAVHLDGPGRPSARGQCRPHLRKHRRYETRSFGFEFVCQKCQAPFRLIARIKNQDIAKKILGAMHLTASVPELHPARPPPAADREARDVEEWLN